MKELIEKEILGVMLDQQLDNFDFIKRVDKRSKIELIFTNEAGDERVVSIYPQGGEINEH